MPRVRIPLAASSPSLAKSATDQQEGGAAPGIGFGFGFAIPSSRLVSVIVLIVGRPPLPGRQFDRLHQDVKHTGDQG